MTIVILVVFGIWFALTLANQLPRARRLVNGTLNSFGVLPSHGLFAPDPRDVDYHLVWRDWLADGTSGEWREIVIEPGTWARSVWNPTGRDGGAMLQLVAALSVLQDAVAPHCRNGARIILVSLPYLVLLQLVCAQQGRPDAVARQFAIVETAGFGASRTVAVGISSPLHPRDPA